MRLTCPFSLQPLKTFYKKRMPLITIVACQPEGSEETLTETSYLTMQLERLVDAALPHITVLTETDIYPLATHLPVGELVIAESTAAPQKTAHPNLQPAPHAPEETTPYAALNIRTPERTRHKY